MILKYSTTGTPYLEMIKGAKLIFSTSTESPKGFKYLVFNNRITRTLCVSGAKSKNKKYVKTSDECSFTTTMDFTKIPKKAKEFGLSNITKKILKGILSKLVDEEGYFPRDNLKALELRLNELSGSEDDYVDDDPTATESYDDE